MLKKVNNKQLSVFLFRFLSVILAVGGSFIILEYAASEHNEYASDFFPHILQMPHNIFILNLMTLGVIWCMFYVLCNRIWIANFLLSFCSGIIAVVNYYVILLHGMPLSFLSLRNFATAVNVIGNYEINIDLTVAKILFMMCMLLGICLVFRIFDIKNHVPVIKAALRSVIILFCSAAVLFFCYFSDQPIKPLKTIGWSWTEAYAKYGYVACTVETAYQLKFAANKPDGYSQNDVSSIDIVEPKNKNNTTPDIILILNETFYDLRQVTQLQEDNYLFSRIESMDNLLQGYAVVPGNGGSTNSAEYELLTSNSLELMPGVTPFNTLNLNGANSIVSHLKALGYYALGTHSESGANYSRKTGYSALQFDTVYFEENYDDVEFYYDRYFETDESLYNNLIRWYEEAPTDRPRFLYMLTIQNHGGYSQNASEYDTVHAKADFGEYDDEVDEFLTAIDQSDAAFVKLTDYFKESDRPVIICMMGDHSPSFAKSIVSEEYSDDEKNLQLRKVPLLIWANYELENQELGTMSMNYVVPTLLETAGIKLSPYYQYLLQLKEQVPILTSYGVFYDKEGNMYHYSQENDPQLDAMVDDYFYLEYHNLQTDRNQTLFDPYE